MDHYYQNIHGWFDFQNVYSFIVAKIESPAVFVEVGTWKGMSTAYLGVEISNSKKNIRVYAVDTFEGSDEPAHKEDPSIINNTLYDEFCKNIEPVNDIIIPIRKASVVASEDFDDSSLDFVFIDGGHTYEDVYADICAWLPKIKSGGWIAGHDYGSSAGVRTAVHLLLPSVASIPPNSWIQQVK